MTQTLWKYKSNLQKTKQVESELYHITTSLKNKDDFNWLIKEMPHTQKIEYKFL